MNKSLVVIFTILLLFVLGELSYLIFFPKTTPLNQYSTIYDSPTPAPTPSLAHAVNLDNLSMLSYWQKGVVSSISANIKLKGVIAEITTNGNVSEHGWPVVPYALKIKVQGSSGVTNDVFLTKEDLQKTTFRKNVNGTNELINYTELSKNDNIEVSLIFDLTKDFMNNFVSAEVTKI